MAEGGFANALNVGAAGADEQGGAITDYTRGEKQETKCRDPFWIILLVITVVAIIGIAVVAGADAIDEVASGSDSTVNTDVNYRGFIIVMLITAVSAFGLSAVLLPIMFRMGNILIKASLIGSCVLYLVFAAVGFLTGNIILCVVFFIMFLVSCCYAWCVWSRVPFATANMVTAMTSVRSNCGVTIVAYVLSVVGIFWTLIWVIALEGVYSSQEPSEEENPATFVMFLLLLAFYFVHQVLTNIIHVTVAGVVGTWWLAPDEAKGCCSPAVKDSFFRSVTTSFGSICFGSFLVALVKALRQLARMARENGEDYQILLCIIECILSCIEDLLEYFNKWAYIYVGLYGYGYIEAGKNVITLFKNRGYEAIIADDLVDTVLFMTALLIGVIAGGIGVLVSISSDSLFANSGVDEDIIPAIVFFVGFLVGTSLSSIIMNVISSAVNAVIVLFMEAPAEFESNYPALSSQMREAWSAIS